jgi:hypothetical protein
MTCVFYSIQSFRLALHGTEQPVRDDASQVHRSFGEIQILSRFSKILIEMKYLSLLNLNFKHQIIPLIVKPKSDFSIFISAI